MKVRDIIKKYLTENGFEGLLNSECGCELEDLMPCDSECGDCQAGYKHKCPEGHEFDWMIFLSKEKPDFGSEG